MTPTDPPPNIGDSDAFVNLLHVAREDADIRRQLIGLLSLDGFHRRSAVHTFTEHMRQRGAPPAFVQAVDYLADDAVAKRARELLEAIDG